MKQTSFQNCLEYFTHKYDILDDENLHKLYENNLTKNGNKKSFKYINEE